MYRILLLLVFVILVRGQTGTVKGFVYDGSSGEPMFLVTVYLEGTNYGTITDMNGFFIMSHIPQGKWTIVLRYLGYDSIKQEITVEEGKVLNLKFWMQKTAITLKGVEVTGEKIEKEVSSGVSYIRLTPVEISKLPSVGALPDISQYIQVLPGVVITGDRGGQIFIRGGQPIQNKFILDGMTVFNPFHSIGIFSVFDVDLINNMDVFRGGFNAEYGDRISSVFSISTRDGNRKRMELSATLSSMGATGNIQIPVVRAQAERGGSSALILSFKHSFVEQYGRIAHQVYSDVPEMPYNFSDIYGKFSVISQEGHKFAVSGIYFTDKVSYPSVDVGWKNYGGSASFMVIPPQLRTNINGVFAYSNYTIDMSEEGSPPRSNSFSNFEGKLLFTYYFKDDHLKYGADVYFYNTQLDFITPLAARISMSDYSGSMGIFAKYRKVLPIRKKLMKSLTLEPGFRLQYYTAIDAVSPEPRLQVKWVLSDKFRIKGAAGRYTQNVFSATTDRDVVSIFPAIMSGDVNVPDTITIPPSTKKAIKYPLQIANHYIGGFEFDPVERLSIELEGYWKDYSQIIEINRNKQFDDTPENINEPDILKKDFWIETGHSYGIDILAKWKTLRFEGTISYSLGYNTRYKEGEKYYPVYDRRHSFNVLLSYTAGKNMEWEFNLRWAFGTGFPFTPTLGFYPLLILTYPSDDYITQNEYLGTMYDKTLSKRLPSYHRLDISISRIIPIAADINLKAILSIVNIYNRKNIFYYDRITNSVVYQLPILINAGLSLQY